MSLDVPQTLQSDQQGENQRNLVEDTIFDILLGKKNYMTAEGDPIVNPEQHIMIDCQIRNVPQYVAMDNSYIDKMKSILFISENLTNVRIAKKENNQWNRGQLFSWKIFKINIYEDFNISVVVETVGMEYLRLIPSIQQDKIKIGTFQVIYSFKAGLRKVKKIKWNAIREYFQQNFNFQDFEYIIFGSQEVEDSIESNFLQFENLVNSFFILKYSEEEICSFFNSIYKCIKLGGEKTKNFTKEQLQTEDSTDNFSNFSTASILNYELLNQNQGAAQEIYFQACDLFFKRISSQKDNLDIVEQITAIQRGQYIKNGPQGFLADFMDNFCYLSFAHMFQESSEKLEQIDALRTYFNDIKQVTIGEFAEQLSVQSLKNHLGNLIVIDEKQKNENLKDFIKLGDILYDLSEFKNLRPFKYNHTSEQINILTYISNKINKISQLWFDQEESQQTNLYSNTYKSSEMGNQQEPQYTITKTSSQNGQYRESYKDLIIQNQKRPQNYKTPISQSLQNIPQTNKFLKRSA